MSLATVFAVVTMLLCDQQRKLHGLDLWQTSFTLLKGHLIAAGQLLSSWSAEARTLTGDWAVGLDAGGHLWEGQAHADSYLSAFHERIEQVGECCTQLVMMGNSCALCIAVDHEHVHGAWPSQLLADN